MSAAHVELRELQRLQEQQAVEDHNPDEDGPHNLAEYVQELVDALEATPAANMAQLYVAANALRTVAFSRTDDDMGESAESDEDEEGE